MASPTQTSRKPGYRQLNARLPEQLVYEINAYAESRGLFRDATLERMLREALAQTGSRTDEDKLSVRVEFTFPEPIKTACEQYLVYFGEFLRDAGVEVTTEFAEKAGTVLFSVTPTDPTIALETVRKALGIYLSLPQNAVARTSATAPLPERKLEANIDHLRHQLQLSTSLPRRSNCACEIGKPLLQRSIDSYRA